MPPCCGTPTISPRSFKTARASPSDRFSTPAGVFGMGIVEAADEAAARAITDKDPAVMEGVGRYEVYPMRLMAKG